MSNAYHHLVPRGRAENLAFRKKLVRAAGGDRAAVIEMCRRDVLFYTNAFVWTYNPRNPPAERVVPFVTWPCQDDAMGVLAACVAGGKDAVMDKSRDMGASWMCLILFEWLWHFVPHSKFLVVSKDEKSVENAGDPDSLFWKIDFLHDHLPDWLLPPGYDRKVHRRHAKAGSFFNPATRSTITGVASTGRAGVGGRATAVFVDEFSQIKEDREVLHRTSDTADCRIFNGTHLGVDTALYELTRRDDIEKVRLHWTQHPEKARGAYRWDPAAKRVEHLDPGYEYPPDFHFVTDGTPAGGAAPGVRSPWYDDQCARKGSARAVAMDLDIDAAGTGSQFFDPVLVRRLQAKYARPPVWTGDLSCTAEGEPNGLVAGDAGRLLLWLAPTPEGAVPPGRYVIGADTSEGRGATPSCLSVVDADTGEKVAAFASATIDPSDFGVLAVALARLFRRADGTPAKLAWESQGPGEDVAVAVRGCGFSNVYYRTDEFVLNKKTSDRPGWYPSPANKRLVLGQYREALRQGTFLNPDARALEECLGFEDTGGGVECGAYPAKGDPSGASTCHGDRVVADALAWMLKLKVCAPVKPGQLPRGADPEADVRTLAGRRAIARRLADEDGLG